MRIATFNLENLDDRPDVEPSLDTRVAVLRPQLERLRADVLCLQEVHSQAAGEGRVLAALDKLLAGTVYASPEYQRVTTTAPDGRLFNERNLVIVSRLPVKSSRILRETDGPRPSYQMATADPPDQDADPVVWERPILAAELELVPGRVLHVLNVHLKSKIATNVPGRKVDAYTWETPSAWAEGSFLSSMKRVGQALQIRMEIDRIFDTAGGAPLIAVCGDFNSDVDDVPLQAICGRVEDTGNSGHGPRVMVPCVYSVAAPARYTLYHLGRGQMFDHVIASRALLATLAHTEIHNEYLPDESGAFRTDVQYPESDHAPVVAQFAG
jgi:endonuclease/exonuclease/phosphatase family protein